MLKLLSAIYKLVAITFVSVLLIFTVLNILCAVFWRNSTLKKAENIVAHSISIESYKQGANSALYDSLYILANVTDALNYSRQFEYYPAAENIHAAYTSRHINTNRLNGGIINRQTLPAGPKADKVIFCFGGSTTFGSLVSDEHTWPAWLMHELNQGAMGGVYTVKNFGNSSYQPSQETQLFLALLRLGYRPSAAIFMDGVNTGPVYDGSEFSGEMAFRFNYTGTLLLDIIRLLSQLPLIEMLRSNEEPKDDPVMFPAESSDKHNHQLANRFIENFRLRKKIGDLYGVPVVQCLQPNVFIDYNYNYFPPDKKAMLETHRSKMEAIKKNYAFIYRETLATDTTIVDLTGLMRSYQRPALVDGMHYSPDFNQYLAQKLIPFLDTGHYRPYAYIPQKATGIAFIP